MNQRPRLAGAWVLQARARLSAPGHLLRCVAESGLSQALHDALAKTPA